MSYALGCSKCLTGILYVQRHTFCGGLLIPSHIEEADSASPFQVQLQTDQKLQSRGYYVCSCSSEFEGEERGVVRQDAGRDLQQVNEGLALSRETVDDVLIMVSDGGFKEE